MISTLQKQELYHRAEIEFDNSDDIVFNWHWPRGTFDRRMSGLEIAAFIMPHMAHILPHFKTYPKVYIEWQALLNRLTQWPVEALDEVLPWIRRLDFNEEDEILQLNLHSHTVAPKTMFFV